jgi:prefoldin subunit 4
LAVAQRYLEELEDASNELMLSDDDNVRFLVGECLVHFEKDTAEGRLEEVGAGSDS